MVWVHGGGFVVGSKDAPISDGTEFARSGVICVAINYRMGIDGFLPVPDVPTNLGLRDILLAMRWVQDNIAAFGGDPSNVTAFGESAGAMAIADLVTSPLAKGLFKRAIIQSGHGAMVRDIPVAQRLVRKLARLLNVTPDADGFRFVSHDRAMAALEKVAKPSAIDLRDANGFEPVFGISRFIPVWGDDVLPLKPVAALREGAGADIEISDDARPARGGARWGRVASLHGLSTQAANGRRIGKRQQHPIPTLSTVAEARLTNGRNRVAG